MIDKYKKQEKRVSQGDGTHHLVSKKESLLEHNSINIINHSNKKVNTFVKLNEKLNEILAYHGGETKEESDGLRYYALDKKYVKLLHPKAKITQVEINPKNIFDYSNNKHVEMLLDKLPENIKIKNNYRKLQKEYTKEEFKHKLNDTVIGNWMILEDKTIQKIIKDLGFDAMYLSEISMSGKEWKNIAMFETLNKELEVYL